MNAKIAGENGLFDLVNPLSLFDMGLQYEIRCENCTYSQTIFEGFGRLGVISKKYFCLQCGEIGLQEANAGWSRVEIDPILSRLPYCSVHPETQMQEITKESLVPCISCQIGIMRFDPTSVSVFD